MRVTRTRRGLALLAVAAAAVLLTAVGPASSAPDKHRRALATITLNGLPIANGFPLDIGIAQGFFAKHGIEIDVASLSLAETVTTGIPCERAMIAGTHPM